MGCIITNAVCEIESCTCIKIKHYNNTNHTVYIKGYYQRKHDDYDKKEHKTIPQTLTQISTDISKMFCQMLISIKFWIKNIYCEHK